MTLRLPLEIIEDIEHQAELLGCSNNEVALTALVNELSRIGTYRCDYYTQLRPLFHEAQRRQCAPSGPLAGQCLTSRPRRVG